MIIRTGYCRPLDYYWCSHDVASIIYYYLRNHAKTITYYLDTYKEALCIIPVVVCKAHKNNPLCQILEKIDDGAPLTCRPLSVLTTSVFNALSISGGLVACYLHETEPIYSTLFSFIIT